MVKFDLGSPPPGLLDKSNEEIVEEFIAALLSAGASEKTAKVYRAAIMDFLDFIGNKPLKEVTSDDVRKWRMHRLKHGFPRKRRHRRIKDPIEERRWRQATLHYYTLLLRGFFEWLGLNVKVPIVKAPRRREVEALSEQEVYHLLMSIRDTLDLLIIGLLIETGLRAQEALELRWRDIDFNNSEIKVRAAKYGEERTVFFGPLTRYALTLWFSERRPQSLDEKVLNISYSGLYKRLKTLAKRAGLDPRKIRPHVFRHTFATQALKKGMSLIAVQKLLGHRDVKITQVYTHLLKEDIRRQYYMAFQQPLQVVQVMQPPNTPMQSTAMQQVSNTYTYQVQPYPSLNLNPIPNYPSYNHQQNNGQQHKQHIVANNLGVRASNGVFTQEYSNQQPYPQLQQSPLHFPYSPPQQPMNQQHSVDSITCPNCKSIIPAQSIYCPYCGLKLR